MSYPPSPSWIEPGPTPLPTTAYRARPRRWWLPYLLALLTIVTAALCGGMYFSSSAPRIAHLFTSGGLSGVLLGLLLAFVTGIPYAIATMLFFLAHEMGHYVACRRYGVDCTLPFFLPAIPTFVADIALIPLFGTFGAVIRIKSPIPNRRALFDIGIAGPLAGFVIAFPLLIVGVLTAHAGAAAHPAPGALFFGDSLLTTVLVSVLRPDLTGSIEPGPLFMAGWLGLLATTMNLIPAGQLDGGHIVYALAPAWHRAISLCSGGFLLGLVTMRGLRYHELSAWMIWTLVVFVLGRNHPPLPEWEETLGTRRHLLAAAALLILVLCFMPVPLSGL